MGINYSRNYGEAIAKSLVTVANTQAQTCNVDVTQESSVVIRNGKGLNVDIVCSGKQRALVATECLQLSKTTNDISNAIAQQSKQIAESVTQQFQLSSAISSNVTKYISEMSTAIENTYTQDCSVRNSQSSSLVIDNVVDSTIKLNCNYDQYADVTTRCVMENTTVNAIAQKINQEMDQAAKATTKNWLAGIIGGIAVAIALVAIVVFIIMFMQSSKAKKPKGEIQGGPATSGNAMSPTSGNVMASINNMLPPNLKGKIPLM